MWNGITRIGLLRAAVLGADDGIVSTASLNIGQQEEADQIAKLLSLRPRSEEEISAMARLPDVPNPS